MNQTLEQLVLRLERIAKRNRDLFRYSMSIVPNTQGTGVTYLFFCEEIEDNHPFLCGSGATLDQAVQQAWEAIEPACADWGYKMVA